MSKEIKKFEILHRENVVVIYDDNSVGVFEIFGKGRTKGGLRELSDEHGFDYEDSWNTQTFGKYVIEHFGGKDKIVIGDYFVLRQENGSIVCAKHFEKTIKDGLRLVAKKIGYKYDETWTTQQLGNHLCKELENAKINDEESDDENQQWWNSVPKNVRVTLLKESGIEEAEAIKIAEQKSAPSEDIIEEIWDLRFVYLNDHQLTDISFLEPFAYLDTVELNDNQISDLSVFSIREDLVVLEVANNNIESIDDLADMIYLRGLNISGNPVESLMAIADMDLYGLDISRTKVTNEEFKWFKKSDGIGLNISNNDQLDLNICFEKLHRVTIDSLTVDTKQREKYADLLEREGIREKDSSSVLIVVDHD